MRSGYRRSLVGYGMRATRIRLEEIQRDLEAAGVERTQTLRSLDARLQETQAAVAEMERAIANQHEEHRSLMGSFQAFFEMRLELIRRTRQELDAEEARALSALAQRQVLLGERRALLLSFQSDARRLVQATRERLAQQGPLLPAGADEASATLTRPQSTAIGTPPHPDSQAVQTGR